MTPIRVAAVVTAHDRREFLPFAVRSALDGGADEVLVVRNFAGPIEGCEGRYKDIPCATPDTNEKEACGLEASQSDVVGFLDDDDLWAPEKVPRLRALFGADPDLVYFCNAHRPIDALGQPVAASHRELADKHPEAFDRWDGKDFESLVRTLWPGNNSSTVVRRTWATEWLVPFREAGWSADLFWLVVALLSRRPILLGADPLTMLRLHGANMSHTRGTSPAEFRARHQTTCERFAQSNGTLARLSVERFGPSAPMSVYLTEATEGFRFFADLEAGRQPRSAAIRALRRHAGRRDRGVLLTALVATGSPALARRLLFRSSERRWRLG
ncbi:MAG: glycosyltransferase family 2 protein [Thermoplasmata archaeon]|nr:glycosyltransferase family 2 protein [Thermoplasmata archaeon]